MRRFKSILFQGNCHPGSTESEILRLYKRFSEGLTLSGGLQQAPMSTDPTPSAANKEELKQLEKEMDHIVRDIAVALTGKEYSPK